MPALLRMQLQSFITESNSHVFVNAMQRCITEMLLHGTRCSELDYCIDHHDQRFE
jgi:hypothetical protein